MSLEKEHKKAIRIAADRIAAMPIRKNKKYQLICSISRKGDCYDNAPLENFWSLLKMELVYRRNYRSHAGAIQDITEYGELSYNRQRRQTALGYLSPAAFAQQLQKRLSAKTDFARSCFDASVAMDNLGKAYDTISRTQSGGRERLDAILEISRKLGLEFISTADAAKTFFGSASGTTLEKDMGRIFTSASKAVFALSLSPKQAFRVFLDLEQMLSKGKVHDKVQKVSHIAKMDAAPKPGKY